MPRKRRYDRPGRPVTHKHVACVETGGVYKTYSDAAEDVGGSRYGVMRCCNGALKTHKGYHFVYTDLDVREPF